MVFHSSGTNLTIQITLPPQFPGERPTLTIQPAVNHPWVDANMKVIGCPSLNNFSMHSDLGQTVHSVLEEFQKSPPAIVPQHYILGFNRPTISQTAASPPQGSGIISTPAPPLPPYPNSQPPVMPPPNFQGNQVSPVPPPLPPRRPPMPANESVANSTPAATFAVPNILSEFPMLNDLKIFELQELADDEDRIHEMVQKVPNLVDFMQQREDLSSTCVQLAQSNLLLKPKIESLKSEVVEKNSELDRIKTDFEQHCQKHMTLSEQYHPSHIQTNLKVAVMEADEESENIAEKFLEKDIDVDEFVKTFMEKRTLCYLRRAKEEKLNQIALSQGHRF
ncbi:vacuolar protein sorting-associated protein 37A-like [Elysia marginata]|uniref:Vacuolar protein sorting-associated protein 37A-like n=1 Tax=Elysia marginata TaxID=1093978 RepID=A0AAV4GXP8_9GAST|nr:vacuolar protein sorting-associated protein 37A-like [Elysia marginata]